jgi:hypothetical protein
MGEGYFGFICLDGLLSLGRARTVFFFILLDWLGPELGRTISFFFFHGIIVGLIFFHCYGCGLYYDFFFFRLSIKFEMTAEWSLLHVSVTQPLP